MSWMLFAVRTPTRAAMTLLVIAAALACFWPGAVAHLAWLAVGAVFTSLWYLLFELKWVLLVGGVIAGLVVYWKVH